MTNVTKIVANKKQPFQHPHSNAYSFIILQEENDPSTSDQWQKAPKYELRTPPKPKNELQIASQKVVKKYRKYAKNTEFRRLKSIVPTLAKKNDASKVSFNIRSKIQILQILCTFKKARQNSIFFK